MKTQNGSYEKPDGYTSPTYSKAVESHKNHTQCAFNVDIDSGVQKRRTAMTNALTVEDSKPSRTQLGHVDSDTWSMTRMAGRTLQMRRQDDLAGRIKDRALKFFESPLGLVLIEPLCTGALTAGALALIWLVTPDSGMIEEDPNRRPMWREVSRKFGQQYGEAESKI